MAFERVDRSTGSDELVLVRPADGNHLERLRIAQGEEIESSARALRRTASAFAELAPERRAAYLGAVCERLAACGEEMVDVLVAETGKPLVEAWAELLAACESLSHHARVGPRWMAGTHRRPVARSLRRRHVAEFLRPVGVYAYLSSWDLPLLQPCKLLAQLFTGGNAVLWKPSEHAALTASRLAGIFTETAPTSGAPLRIVLGDPATGERVVELVRAGRVDEIAFTGEGETWERIASALAGRVGDPLISLRGNNPMILWRDVDARQAARAALSGAFHGAGQSCLAVKRTFVHRDLHEAFLKEVRSLAEHLVLGPGDDRETDVGPMVSRRERDLLQRLVEAAVGCGAVLVRGGKPPTTPRLAAGNFLEPAIVDGCDAEMALFREGPRGPALAIHPFGSLEEAVGLANEGPHGLAACVFARDPDLAERIGRSILAGSVHINDLCWILYDPGLPLVSLKHRGSAAMYGQEGFLRCVRRSRMLRRSSPVDCSVKGPTGLGGGERELARMRAALRARFSPRSGRLAPGLRSLWYLLRSSRLGN